VGWIASGEWLTYAFNAPAFASYAFKVRVASGYAGTKQLHVDVDGASVGSLSFTDANGWDSYFTRSVGKCTLSPGHHVLRVGADTKGFDLNYIDVSYARSLGAFYGERPDAATIDAYAQLTGRMPAITMWYEGWGYVPPVTSLDAVKSKGSVPSITWEPNNVS